MINSSYNTFITSGSQANHLYGNPLEGLYFSYCGRLIVLVNRTSKISSSRDSVSAGPQPNQEIRRRESVRVRGREAVAKCPRPNVTRPPPLQRACRSDFEANAENKIENIPPTLLGNCERLRTRAETSKLLQSSPLLRSAFCPMKIDHTSGLTLYPGY